MQSENFNSLRENDPFLGETMIIGDKKHRFDLYKILFSVSVNVEFVPLTS